MSTQVDCFRNNGRSKHLQNLYCRRNISIPFRLQTRNIEQVLIMIQVSRRSGLLQSPKSEQYHWSQLETDGGICHAARGHCRLFRLSLSGVAQMVYVQR